LLTIASLNTRGIPLTGSQLAERYALIGAGFDAGDADVVCFQEVLTYWHLRLLVRRMRSFRRVSWRPGPFGPMGGLVTFSRRPVSGTTFRRFGRPPRAPGVPGATRVQARLKGALVTRLGCPELCVINTHPVANHDGDWSQANRFYPLHRAEFDVLARVVNQAGPRAVVCGDFNVARESPLFGEFMAATGLADAFGGVCPPTFRVDYLPAGATPHCIDFILTAGEVTAESAALVFAEKEPLGYVSDHIGLRARLRGAERDLGGSEVTAGPAGFATCCAGAGRRRPGRRRG
jgi:sphingomyelin phosphodiesterase 2